MQHLSWHKSMEIDYSTVIMQCAYTVKADEKTENKKQKNCQICKNQYKILQEETRLQLRSNNYDGCANRNP